MQDEFTNQLITRSQILKREYPSFYSLLVGVSGMDNRRVKAHALITGAIHVTVDDELRTELGNLQVLL